MNPSFTIKFKYPTKETPWVVLQASDGTPRYLITSRPTRDLNYIYQINPDGTTTKLGRSNDPGELQEKYYGTLQS